MGHIVNPHLFRLNYVINWSSVLVSKKKFSAYFDTKNLFISDFINVFFKKNKNVTKFMLYLLFFKIIYNCNSFVLYLVFKQHKDFFKKKSKVNLIKNITKNLLFLHNKKFLSKYTFFKKAKISLLSNFSSINFFLKRIIKNNQKFNYFLIKKTLIKKKIKSFIFKKKIVKEKLRVKQIYSNQTKKNYFSTYVKKFETNFFKINFDFKKKVLLYNNVNPRNFYNIKLIKKKLKKKYKGNFFLKKKKIYVKFKFYKKFSLLLKSKIKKFNIVNKSLISILKKKFFLKKKLFKNYNQKIRSNFVDEEFFLNFKPIFLKKKVHFKKKFFRFTKIKKKFFRFTKNLKYIKIISNFYDDVNNRSSRYVFRHFRKKEKYKKYYRYLSTTRSKRKRRKLYNDFFRPLKKKFKPFYLKNVLVKKKIKKKINLSKYLFLKSYKNTNFSLYFKKKSNKIILSLQKTSNLYKYSKDYYILLLLNNYFKKIKKILIQRKKILSKKKFKSLKRKKIYDENLKSSLNEIYHRRFFKDVILKENNSFYKNFNLLRKKNFYKHLIFKKLKIKNIFKILLSKMFLFQHYMKTFQIKKKIFNFFLILFPKMDINIFILIKTFCSSFTTSNMIADYFILRLLQKKLVVEIMKPMIKFLNKSIRKKKIYGYAVLLMGRFTRKDRATYKWYKKGPFTKSNRLINIDYASRKVFLKFSTCSFKINLIKTINYKNL